MAASNRTMQISCWYRTNEELARCFIWWSDIDKDIEAMARSCEACASYSHMPPEVALYPWEFPKFPWMRIHIDFEGPFFNKM